MKLDFLAVFFMVLGLLLTETHADVKFKICASVDIPNSYCAAVETTGDAICVRVSDSVNCAIKLLSGEANVASFTPEQALVVAQYLNSTVSVAASIRHKTVKNESFSFQGVVVVKDSHQGGVDTLKGSKYCRVNSKYERVFTKRVLNEFEKSVVPLKCGVTDSFAADDEIGSLAKYFAKSCRPGKWVEDDTIDKNLKNKYSSLCDLCDDQQKCDYSSNGMNPNIDALRCLTKLDGDVTFAALRYVRAYFGLDTSAIQEADPSQYKYLCRDGTTQAIHTGVPCTWIQQPWSVIVAKPDIITDLKNHFDESSHGYKSSWIDALKDVLQISNDETIIVANATNSSFSQYVEQGRKFPQKGSNFCKRNLKWCTTSSEEKQKCDWLSLASRSAGITPEFDCVEENDVLDCLDSINRKKTDIISIDSNLGYVARKTYHLEPVVYHTTNKDKSFVIAIVKEEDVQKYKSYSDLKNSKGCLPLYGGIAWVSLIETGKQHNVLKAQDCDYGAAVSNYFSSACVPGARDKRLGLTPGTKSDVLCSLCQGTSNARASTNCDANPANNDFFGDVGAVKCLHTSGDVAVIERTNISSLGISENSFHVLCKNNSLAAFSGFNVDEDCALSVTVDSETITRHSSNSTPMKLFLLDLENSFGLRFDVMGMFDQFKGKKNLLFKSNVLGFEDVDNPNNKYAKNYQQLFNDVDVCFNGASQAYANVFIFVGIITFVLARIFAY